ncbi:fructose bisphosphate aldolase [Amylibacter kogurei]|uniref:fructose-bisphosphate aldolase n=1 Tax=Paramylibacter kogurei TaxID=1889778 RepID=A0A2G5K5X7_9RHOB|nr:fructose bisphosphate aldolase [Amylibacter kogurei]PIB24947.1 fructose bisphosphate aldolase [Amylibacter kogurei]
MSKSAQAKQMETGAGFIAALDQSGGSTPKALALYGIGEDGYANDAEMYDLIHAMRARIATATAFTGDKVIGAILFEMTMDREIDGMPTAQYIWEKRGVVPFLKVDKGLEADTDGVQLMKPIDGLSDTLARANKAGIFGTKMRSVISAAHPDAIDAIVSQQFDIGKEIIAAGLMPILEPEITISIDDKSQAEDMLRDSIAKHLADLPKNQKIMLKLTLPETPNQYKSLIDHPQVMRVVALSGGYSREQANAKLAQNAGMIASFSRALSEGLSADQSDEDFNATIAATIDEITAASNAG